jgi:hypothetical protein
MKIKGIHLENVAEIHEAVTYEINKVQTEEFSAAFQKLYDRTKACGTHFELEKVVCLPRVSSSFKKSVLKHIRGFAMLCRKQWTLRKQVQMFNSVFLLRFAYSFTIIRRLIQTR